MPSIFFEQRCDKKGKKISSLELKKIKRVCWNTHEREVHTRTIEKASFKISLYLGNIKYYYENPPGIFIWYACGLLASCLFSWETLYPNFTDLGL